MSHCFERTLTGINFDIFNPTSDMFDIRDIARSLAVKPRFNGFTKVPYSVAQHCLYASQFDAGDDRIAMDNLLHEIGETYLCDCPTQIKKLWTGFKQCEENILFAGLMKYTGRDRFVDPLWTHTVDLRLRTTEAHQLMNGDKEWYLNFPDKAYDFVIDPLDWHVAEKMFLTRFEQLGGTL